MAEAVFTRRGGGASLELVSETSSYIFDYTVTSATTSLTFDGFELEEDSEYVLYIDAKNTVGISQLKLSVNNNTTSTNYYLQNIRADVTSISAGRENNNNLGTIYSSYQNSYYQVKLKLTNNGYFTYQSNLLMAYNAPSNFNMFLFCGTSTFTVPSITSLTLTASTNCIGVDSRFTLRKITGETKTWDTI